MFSAHSHTRPVAIQSVLRSSAPREHSTKATPMRRNPTIPFTPEHAVTTLIEKA